MSQFSPPAQRMRLRPGAIRCPSMAMERSQRSTS
jgi:hypothetical protein